MIITIYYERVSEFIIFIIKLASVSYLAINLQSKLGEWPKKYKKIKRKLSREAHLLKKLSKKGDSSSKVLERE